MNSPAYLKPGSTIAIAASARKVNAAEIADAVAVLASWGLKVVLSDTIYEEQHQFAGTDEVRTMGLQQLLDDPQIEAILFARGGYGSIRIIDSLNFDKFLQQPKWLIGFSDITVFLAHLSAKYHIPSMHACMAFNMQPERFDRVSVESLKSALFGEGVAIEFDQHPHNTLMTNLPVSGELIGGNLSVLYAMLGSESLPDPSNKILFLEDLDEYLYHIDRMMMGLKRANFFKGLKAVLIGGMSDMKDNAIPFGKCANEIIQEALSVYQIPIVFGLPCGHEKINKCLLIGKTMTVSSTPSKVTCIQAGI